MTGGEVFKPWGLSHGVVLALTVLVPVMLTVWVRRAGGRRSEGAVRWALALVMAANMGALVVIGVLRGQTDWVDFLPMHLCDWLGFILIVALTTKRQGAFELAYFWGLAGTSQGVLTPDLQWAFPHPYFFTFHVGHSGVIVAVVFLLAGCGMRPRRGAFWRAWLWLQVYALAAAATNWLLDENFGYLCAKPENPSLLDYLGPWPWYVLSLQGLALGLFFLLELPWRWLPPIREFRFACRAEAGEGR